MPNRWGLKWPEPSRTPEAVCALTEAAWLKGADTLLKSNEAYKLVFREYPDVVNVEQMSEMLGGISTKTGYRLLRQNQIKHFKIGRTYKIPKLHIFEYLAVVQGSDE
jgi:excisionase family DNA binding protein